MLHSYQELLDSLLNHLQTLRAKGDRFIIVDQENWAGLRATGATRGSRRLPAAKPRQADSRATASQIISAPAEPSPSSKSQASHERSLGAIPEPAPPPLTANAKVIAMAELRARALGCSKCAHLAASRQHVVFGTGNIDSALMFVGEAPGADEDVAGEPFVGRAGQLLTRIIETMGLTRAGVYIGNIVKCRPDTPGQAFGNRKPTNEEMSACIPFLEEQINIIQPKVLIALGRTALEGLIGGSAPISTMRGRWQSYRGIPLMPTYHPSYVMRTQTLEIKREIWMDMLEVMRRVGLPISEKQLGFFLKA